MSIFMTLRIAFKALGRNKLRTMLTMLGIIIGVAAVIATVAMGTGAKAMIEEQIRAGGTNMITIMPGSMNVGGVRTGAGGNVKLIPEDAVALRDLPDLEYVSEIVNTRQPVIYSNNNWQTSVQGVNVDFPTIRSWPQKYGSFFSPEDVKSANKVCVLGSNVSDTLFGEGVDPTDITIRVKNQLFRVVGVMASKGASTSGTSLDDQVFAPFTTVMKKLQGQQNLNQIIVSARSADGVATAASGIANLMRTQHQVAPGDPDDVTVMTQDDQIALRTSTTQTMGSLLMGIAAVSLLVGGIGIMNIMLVSVTERTREIGLRMAIGARGFDVLLQFLIEAIVISVFGGTIGIALGYGISEFLERYQNIAALVPPDAVVIAVGFSAAVGVFFGFYPARKAAGLDPIEALRFE